MGKNKLAKFGEMESFPHVFQYTFSALKATGETFPMKGKWSEFFGNGNPIVLELGCGRGEYTVALAELFPEKNFIGVDIKGARMWAGAKESLQKGLKNVAFIRTNIEIIDAFFAPNEVAEIWLTFPDPQMKKVRKRLTSTRFMDLYQKFVVDGGLIHLKTDSNFLYQYTCEMVKANHYKVEFQNDDLYHSDFSDDRILSIKTFYEQQWIERGLTIKHIRFVLDKRETFVEPDVEIEYDNYRSYNRTRRGMEKSNEEGALSFDSAQNLVKKSLKALDWDINPHGLYDPIAYVLSLGGKRIRPTCALLACRMFSDDYAKALSPALALEVFHNFTLLHDDIMDKADMRRGQPTVHVKWNDNTAILSGDAMLIKAYQLLAKCEPNVYPAISAIFSQTAVEVCEGQQYDMDFESRNDVSVDEYMEMIRLKTAVLLAASLQIGAICGGAKEEDAKALYEYGIGIGLAFQLKDDLLDVWGDVKKFGKKIGGDICCNKKTFLLINAYAKANAEEKKELDRWLLAETTDRDAKVSEVTRLYERLGIKTLAEQTIRTYYDRAIEALDKVGVEKERKEVLYQLAYDLMYRED